MNKYELIEQYRAAEFPKDVAEGLQCLITAAAALRPLYPPEFLYNVDFGGRCLFSKIAWYRAVYAEKTPIDVIMLDDDPQKHIYYLWRFMVAPPFQSRGFGAAAIKLLINHVKTRPKTSELLPSYIDHKNGPAGFYRSLGFAETGNIDDGEIEMALPL